MSTTATTPTTPAPPKPLLRGWIHEAAFFAAIPAGIVLVLSAPTARSRIAAGVFALSLVGMYGISAAYHRGSWTPERKRALKRIDHSMIFVLIAGTYTPFALLVLHGTVAFVLLLVVWSGALAGVALKVARVDDLAALSGALYIILGWLVVALTPQLLRALSTTEVVLTAAGGVAYTLGAIVLAAHRPNPSPRVFGYHEVWHVFTVIGGACHYVVITLVVHGLR